MYPHFLLLAPMQPAEGGGSLIGLILPFLLIAVVFYFFLIRPQRKRQKEHDQMVTDLKKGDKVTTIGGIHGTITRVEDASVLAQVDSGVKLRFDKNAIANVAGEDE